MSDQADSAASDGRDGERSRLAMRLVTNSLAVIWALIGALVIVALLPLFNAALVVGDSTSAALDKILSGILPLLGAWIGAIIAFYFGRENYDAAVRNLRQLRSTDDQLASIFVKDVMVPAEKLVTAATPGEDALALQSGILPRLEQRGLGRLIVVAGAKATPQNTPPANAAARGVVHDSVINRFIATRLAAGEPAASVTLGALLADPDIARLLNSAVVYVTPETTLAEVRRRMDEASKSASASVRDALVTATGQAGEPLLGYLTDIDLADNGALK